LLKKGFSERRDARSIRRGSCARMKDSRTGTFGFFFFFHFVHIEVFQQIARRHVPGVKPVARAFVRY
jgi:hypothetical protein